MDKKEIFYDGSCPMCTVLIHEIGSSSQNTRFSPRDITKEPLPLAFTKEQVEREIHVVDVDGKIYKNAEAVLKILEEYPKLKWVARIGSLPLVRNVLPIGYNFVAANRHFLFGPASRIYWVKTILGMGFISGVLLSLKLWISTRFYPLTPVLEIFPPVPFPVDLLILLGILCLLVMVVISSRYRFYLLISVGIFSALIFLDQSRLQPWVYQYLVMLLVLGVFSWKFDDIRGQSTILNICRFIVASIYFYSGLQKANALFVYQVFPWIVDPITRLFSEPMVVALYFFGTLVPFIEMGIGIGLLTRKFRRMAIVFTFAMCAFVLWTIGPFGHNWNSVVWPWNIVMVLLVLTLFLKTDTVTSRDILLVRDSLLHKIILAAFGLFPLLSFFNYWDSYLSWSLYSGNTNQAVIYMSTTTKNQLPIYIQSYVATDEYRRNVLEITNWAFGELNTPPYPETRVFKNVARSICKYTQEPQQVVLLIQGRPSWFNGESQKTLICSDL